MKHCIIKSNLSGGYSAYDENGGLICKRLFYSGLVETVKEWGYIVAPLNSRFARTILDKLEGQVI